ncbi:unnamed protein product [Oikopleura dioica]|uniref:Uncharacterized protein n=1 Tax=Oikopleura dioica TaxID=34765 RepID=E4YD51_OIKDI|nr:unnamed protein product [Oikopleura dioica]
MVILSSLSDSYIINGDGSTKKAAQISAPSNDYTDSAKSAVVADKFYLFGGRIGYYRKIARLESCTIVELTVELNYAFATGHAALATADNSQALICFGSHSPQNYCDIFDGSNVVTTFSTTYPHNYGGLGYYNGQPTTVGGDNTDAYRKVETLSQNGWTSLADHPRNVRGHNLVGLENGDMLLIGGYDGAFQSKVWRLSRSEATWSEEATLKKAMGFGSSIKLDNQIYSFGGSGKGGIPPIQRLDLAEDGTIEQIELIGNQDAAFYLPILYIVDAHTCTNN